MSTIKSDPPFVVLENVLTKKEADFVIQYFRENEKREDRKGYSSTDLPSVSDGYYQKIKAESIDERIRPLLRVLNVCRDYFQENYVIKHKLEFKRSFLNKMTDSAKVLLHSDDNDVYKDKRINEEHYSGILLLSSPSHYKGGYLSFDNWKEIKLKPDAGDLVLFKGDNMHSVDPVTEGERINHIIFFRDVDLNSDLIYADGQDVEEGRKNAKEYK